MRKLTSLGIALLLTALQAMAQTPAPAASTLSAQEREMAIKELQATRERLKQATAGLSEAQLNYRSAPDRWSVGQVVEHLALTENLIMSLITEKMLKSPATPEKKMASSERDMMVLKGVADRTNKFKAPEMLQPKGEGYAASLSSFNERRDGTIQFVRTTQDDLRAHIAPHPVLKDMDAYQWVLLMAGHTNRHIDQIEEVKSDPSFPK